MGVAKALFCITLLVAACSIAHAIDIVEDSKDAETDYGTVIGIDLGTTYSW
jgi:hypothetical protein